MKTRDPDGQTPSQHTARLHAVAVEAAAQVPLTPCAPPVADPVLEVRDLRCRFRVQGKWVDVLKQVSFNVPRRTTVAIVGESGSGKSVTALSIMGLNQAADTHHSGSILFNGQNLLARSERQMQRIRGKDIAMIFQEPMSSLNPVISVGKQVAEVLVLHGDYTWSQARAEAIRLLDMVRIADAHQRYAEYPHQLSGGMRQRIAIAMALACRPQLLIADEPTTALDVTTQAEILDLMATLQQQVGTSLLFITHDMGVVAEIADRTVVMQDGHVVESGTTHELFSGPKHAYTQSLLAAAPIPGFVDARLTRPAGEASRTLAPAPAQTVAHHETPVLQVENLVTRFPAKRRLWAKTGSDVHAVQDVSFSIRAGETLALVGESGSGKSTIGRSIVGLAAPDSGRILVAGIDVLALPPAGAQKQRRQVQIIFQDPFGSLNPRMTIGSAIAEPIVVHRRASRTQAWARAGELLGQVGLSSTTLNRYPHEFSGGQRQRICIARALALEPKLLIADEAVSALDATIKAQIINLLLELQAKMKLALLFISHDMAAVERISHRIAVMYRGEIVELGTREAVLNHPRHPYTKRLLAAVPVPDPRYRQSRKAA